MIQSSDLSLIDDFETGMWEWKVSKLQKCSSILRIHASVKANANYDKRA